MTGFKSLEDVEKAVAKIKKCGKKDGEKYLHISDHIEATYELEDGTLEQDEDFES